MLPVLQAERQLLAIEAASVPHMEQRGQRQVIDRHVRRAQEARPKTATEALAAAGIRVVHVPPSPRKRPRRGAGQAGTRQRVNRG